jgi:hypothetical protein
MKAMYPIETQGARESQNKHMPLTSHGAPISTASGRIDPVG